MTFGNMPFELDDEATAVAALPPMAPPASGRRWTLRDFNPATARLIEKELS